MPAWQGSRLERSMSKWQLQGSTMWFACKLLETAFTIECKRWPCMSIIVWHAVHAGIPNNLDSQCILCSHVQQAIHSWATESQKAGSNGITNQTPLLCGPPATAPCHLAGEIRGDPRRNWRWRNRAKLRTLVLECPYASSIYCVTVNKTLLLFQRCCCIYDFTRDVRKLDSKVRVWTVQLVK